MNYHYGKASELNLTDSDMDFAVERGICDTGPFTHTWCRPPEAGHAWGTPYTPCDRRTCAKLIRLLEDAAL